MRQSIFLLILVTGFSFIQAQTDVDSLEQRLISKTLTADEQMEIYRQLCYNYSYNDLEKHRKCANIGLQLAIKERNNLMLARFNEYIAINFHLRNNYDTADIYYKKALFLAIDLKNRSLEAEIYNNLAILYGNKNDIITELEYYKKAIYVEEKYGKIKETLIVSYYNLGVILKDIHNYQEALNYFEKALALANEIDYNNGKSIANYGIGAIYCEWKMFDKAEKYLLEGYYLSKNENNIEFTIQNASYLAFLYLDGLNDYNQAEIYANECLELAENYKSKESLLSAWSIISQVYLYQGLAKKAETIALQAWALDSVYNNTLPKLAMIITMANIQMENREKAEMFLNKYIELNDEYRDKNMQETLLGLEVKYETEKKELRISSLEKEKQLYIWLSIAGGVVLLLAFGVLFYRHRLNIHKMKQLEQEKQLIATQSILDGETAERSRLARDLHDGLGGMLSVVKLNLKEMRNYSILDGQDVDRFSNALGMLDQSITELRRVAHHMMPESLMRYGLKISIEDFCRAIPNAHFQYYGSEKRLDDRLEVILYRCAYELVNNAVKYSEATVINVQLMIDNGLVSITVQDNGIGFDPDKVASGSGLDNIRTRVSAYNGKMTIHSSLGNGTEVSVEIENQA